MCVLQVHDLFPLQVIANLLGVLYACVSVILAFGFLFVNQNFHAVMHLQVDPRG